jgi:hypothetical protein
MDDKEEKQLELDLEEDNFNDDIEDMILDTTGITVDVGSLTTNSIITGGVQLNSSDWIYVNPANEQMDQVLKRLEQIEKRLCIVDNSDLTDEQRESLKVAYNEYKMMEKLIIGDRDANNT